MGLGKEVDRKSRISRRSYLAGAATIGVGSVVGFQVTGAVMADVGETRWTLGLDTGLVGTPTVADGTLYVTSEFGGLYAVGTDSGTVQWNVKNSGSRGSSVTVVDRTVYAVGAGISALDSGIGTWNPTSRIGTTIRARSSTRRRSFARGRVGCRVC